MGKAYSHFVKRPAKNWNIEHRTMKKLDQMERNKPAMAPQHPSSAKFVDQIASEHPELKTEVKNENKDLISNMEKLIANPEKASEITSKRSLPTNRKPHKDLEYGYEEPEMIPPGKVTIRQTMELLSLHFSDPQKHTPESIAIKYNLNKDVVDILLKHFHIFQIHMPKGTKAAEILESPDLGAKPGFIQSAKEKLLSDK